MGDCPKPKSEVTFSDPSLMQCGAVGTDASTVEHCVDHFPQDAVSSGDSYYGSVSGGEEQATSAVADKETEMCSDEDASDMRTNNLLCDSRGVLQGSLTSEITDEPLVPSCGPGTVS
ncbi:hypothetical protein HPB50_022452 [Hyalomma asiaticum]|uniref:Uncharacterized protein n=1 Tax=Hyalomma asiaticum TaxID=266040 RepID=A0ACB7SQ85_HYAAI|nr:hypothetical protein HPB50_022452 [Hyalomma asiaticum]